MNQEQLIETNRKLERDLKAYKSINEQLAEHIQYLNERRMSLDEKKQRYKKALTEILNVYYPLDNNFRDAYRECIGIAKKALETDNQLV